MESPRFSQQVVLSTRSAAVVKGIRHIESQRVRLDSRLLAIGAGKLGPKPTPGLASLKPWERCSTAGFSFSVRLTGISKVGLPSRSSATSTDSLHVRRTAPAGRLI